MAAEPKPQADRPNYYKHGIDAKQLTEEVRELLKSYSGIAEAEIEPHLLHVRDKAFDARPYVCIGQWLFLNSSFPNIPGYKDVRPHL